MEGLNTTDLITLHENLSAFASHNQDKGGQQAHRLIKAMGEDMVDRIKNGSQPDGYCQGYGAAIKDCLELLRKHFVR